MQIKQEQKTISNILNIIDSKLWDALAIKSINNMPKHKLSLQSGKVLHDFVVQNGKINLNKKSALGSEEENLTHMRDNRIIGGVKLVQRVRSRSQSQKPTQRSNLLSQTNQTDQNHRKTLQSLLNRNPEQSAKMRKISFNEAQDEQQLYEQNRLRKTKFENSRYSQKLEQATRERMAKSQQRSQAEQKKHRELKSFTYDYEGKLLSSNLTKEAEMKLVHLKYLPESRQKFNTKNIKQHKQVLQKLRKDKTSIVKEKRIITSDENQQGEVRESKLMRTFVTGLVYNFVDLFKNDSMEEGVSVVDAQSNYKVMGTKSANHNTLKLSQFKTDFKSSTVQREAKKQRTEAIPQEKSQEMRMKTMSEAESKVLSSCWSKRKKGPEKLIVNNSKAFLQSFYDSDI